MRLSLLRTFALCLLPGLFIINSQSGYANIVSTIGGEPPAYQACRGCSSWSDEEFSDNSPISITEGNLKESYEVIQLRSSFGATIDFSLHYNSYNADDSRAMIDTVMGYGWTHSYNIFLFSQGMHIFRMDGKGRVAKFTRGAGGAFTAPPGYFETLVQTSVNTFTITTKDKTVFTFALIPNTPFSVGDAVYRLTSIADRNNNSTGLSYTGGNLTGITDTYSRSLALTYNGQNKLISITDPLMRTTALQYDASARQLLKITDPENKFIQYNYNSLYQLTGKVDKDGRAFSYLYENLKPVAMLNGAGASLFRISNSHNWATDANALAVNQLRVYVPASTTLIDGRGNAWVYDYDGNGYITRIVVVAQLRAAFSRMRRDEPNVTLFPPWPIGGTATSFIFNPATLKLASATDSEGRTTNYSYDPMGNLINMTNALGHFTTYTYEPTFNQKISMVDANGRMTTYECDLKGNRTRETDPLGHMQEWTYDGHGNVLTETDRNGNLTQFVYNSTGNLLMMTEAVGSPSQRITTMTNDVVGNELSRTDPNAYTTTHVFDNLDRLTHEIDPAGKVTQTFYDGMDNPTKVIDRNNNATLYQYDLRQRLMALTDALGRPTTAAYDGNDNLVSSNDRNGQPTRLEYDARNRPFRMTDALNNKTTRIYDGVGNPLSESDANNHTTLYEYDRLNRRLKMIDPLGAVTLYQYDMVGLSGCPECTGPTRGSNLITKQTDCNGKVVYFKYDGRDRLIIEIHKEGDTADVIDPSDAVTRYAYDANGNRLSLKEPNGNMTTFNYDPLNRLVKQTNAAGEMTINTYDGVGNLITRTDPNTNIVTNTYDALNRLIQVDDRVGRVVSYGYDSENNRVSETDGNGNVTLSEYDALHRVTRVTDSLGEKTQTQYDSVGNILKTTDRAGQITTYLYDHIHRRTSMTNALGHTIRYEYDGVGNLLKNIDAKPTPGITQYEYDGRNRLTRETHPDSPPNTRTFTYDCVGNLKTETDQRGQTITYNYNDLYFLIKRDYPTSADDNMTYDLSGRLLAAERGGWVITFNYDGANRVTQSTQNGKTVNYVYNIPGRTRALTYPGGRNITEQMDFRDRKTGINDAASPRAIVQYNYDFGNRVTSRAYRNGTATSYAYNANDWIMSLEHSRGATRLAGFGYAYDKEGNRRFEEKKHNPAHSEVYEYDAAYRLIDYKVTALLGVPRPLTQISYNLDEVGNWKLKVTNRRLTETRTHNAVNELTSIGGLPLIHDDNGNLTEDQFYRYAYDEENRLLSVTRKLDNRILGRYQYDALGRRVVKVANLSGTPTETRYFYDDERVIEEQSALGVTRASYVYGNYVDEALTMERGGQTYYYHQNSMWSVAAVTDSAGVVVERYQYDPYGGAMITDAVGNPLGSISAIGNPWMFTGRQFDEETGLYNYRTRYLDSSKGRFISRDSIGTWADAEHLGNGYTYAANNPFSFIDPDGTKSRAERRANRAERKAERKEKRAERKEKRAEKKEKKGKTRAAERLRMKAANLRWEASTLRKFKDPRYEGKSRVRVCGRCWGDPITSDSVMLKWDLKEVREPMADNGFEIVIEENNAINVLVNASAVITVQAGASSYLLEPLYSDTKYKIGLKGWKMNGNKDTVCKIKVRTDP